MSRHCAATSRAEQVDKLGDVGDLLEAIDARDQSFHTTARHGKEPRCATAVHLIEALVATGKPVVIKAGILDNAPISVAQVEALAKVPPRDQLRAEVVGAIQGPLSQTYGVLTAPLRDLINVLEARIRALGGEAAA